MHVQMFTHQHLRMQGKIDTIVLRTVERAGHGSAGRGGDGVLMGCRGRSGARRGCARRAAVADVREIRPPRAVICTSSPIELAPMVDVWKRLLAQHVPDRAGRCVVCTKGGTGLPSTPWPCSIHGIAEMARRKHDEECTDRPAV